MTDITPDTGAKDQTDGISNQIKGRVGQTVGSLTGDREAQAQGALDEAKGKIQQAIGDLKDKMARDDAHNA